MTTINVKHMLELAARAAGGTFRHTLPELANNLRELRDRSHGSPSEALKACDEFFELYTFGVEVHPENLPAGWRWVCERCESVNVSSHSECAGCGKAKPAALGAT